jgi:hypothetical protein
MQSQLPIKHHVQGRHPLAEQPGVKAGQTSEMTGSITVKSDAEPASGCDTLPSLSFLLDFW